MSQPEPDDNDGWGEAIPAVTIALVEGDRLPLVLDPLGADRASERLVTSRQAEQQVEHVTRMPVQAELRDGWTLLVKPSGFWASRPDNTRRLSEAAGGRFVSLYWNVDSVMRLLYAVNGTVQRSFDPVVPDFGPHGDPLLEETGLLLGVDGADSCAAGIALIERLTAVRPDLGTVVDTPRTWSLDDG